MTDRPFPRNPHLPDAPPPQSPPLRPPPHDNSYTAPQTPPNSPSPGHAHHDNSRIPAFSTADNIGWLPATHIDFHAHPYFPAPYSSRISEIIIGQRIPRLEMKDGTQLTRMSTRMTRRTYIQPLLPRQPGKPGHIPCHRIFRMFLLPCRMQGAGTMTSLAIDPIDQRRPVILRRTLEKIWYAASPWSRYRSCDIQNTLPLPPGQTKCCPAGNRGC
jgi:hypothetical protein